MKTSHAPLTMGDKAPAFSVKDISDVDVVLADYADSYVLLAFLRYAGCPWCNLALHRLVMEAKLLKESNCNIIAFVQSTKENIITNIYKRHAKTPAFPIVSGHGHNAFDDYRVSPSVTQAVKHIASVPHWVKAVRKDGLKQGKIDGSLFLAPAMFLVRPRDQHIIRADYNANLYEHMTFSKLYDAIVADQYGLS